MTTASAKTTAEASSTAAAVEAICVRLTAKVMDAASIAPVIEQHTLTRGADDVSSRSRPPRVNPSDVKAATRLMPCAVFPRTPGRDYAGVVVDGPSGWVGREVFGSSGDLGIRRDGTHASHLVVETAAVVEKPAQISMEEAAGIGVPLLTAIEGFRRTGQPKPGETVLIMRDQRQGRTGGGATGDLARRAGDRGCARGRALSRPRQRPRRDDRSSTTDVAARACAR